jgi:hypothetical protein
MAPRFLTSALGLYEYEYVQHAAGSLTPKKEHPTFSG